MEIESTVNAVTEQVVDAQPIEQVESENVDVTTTQPDEKPIQSKEDNAKYAEIRRKYEAEKAEAIQKAKDDLIAEQYGDSHGIRTEAEYKKALEKAKQQAEIEKIQAERNYTEEEAQEILEARQIKAEKLKAEQEAMLNQSRQAKEQQENIEFFEYFKEQNGRDFAGKEDIPEGMKALLDKGIAPKYAYMEYQLNQLKQGQAVQKLNAENAQASIGSVKGDGVLDSGFISESEFETKKSDQRWVIKNLDKITKSRLKW